MWLYGIQHELMVDSLIRQEDYEVFPVTRQMKINELLSHSAVT